MQVIYPIVCGVDVHKTFIVAVICDSTSIEPKYIRKRFSTFKNSLIDFRDWLLQHDCQNVCMESTGKYYIPVYNALEGHISNVVVANPKWVRAVKGEKDDNKDAKWIADLFKLGMARSSFISGKDIRILRELTRYLYKVVGIASSEKNRFQNALVVGNLRADMVFSDVFGKSASSVVDLILSNDDVTDKENLSELIQVMIEPYESFVTLLCTIPGVSRKSAITILSEIGPDMSQFSNHYRLSKWAGLAPGQNASAGKKKSTRISRAGVYLKPCLVEVAHAAVKNKKEPYFSLKFNKISKRRGKKRAYIAIARKILVCAYHMLMSGEAFKPSDLADVETPKEQRARYIANNLRQSIKELNAIGVSLEEIITMMKQTKGLKEQIAS